MLSWRVVGVRELDFFDVVGCMAVQVGLCTAQRARHGSYTSQKSRWRAAPLAFKVCYITLAFTINFFCQLLEPCEAAGQPAQSLASLPYGAASTFQRARGLPKRRCSTSTCRPPQPGAARRRRSSRMALLLLLIAATAYALDRPTSRFQNAFGNSGSSVRRKRTLPVYRPPDSPATPLPVPGSSRTLRYQPEGAANAQLVRDLQQYGALVVVIGDGDEEPIGCVVDVRLAEVSDEGQAAVVASCTSSNARVSLGRVAKAFPYTAREVSTLEDTDFLYADDVLAAYDVIEEDEPSTSKARNDCVDLLEATLDLCDKLRPTLGAVDAFGTESGEGEYARMAQRLREAVAKDDDEADEERDRRLSFLVFIVS